MSGSIRERLLGFFEDAARQRRVETLLFGLGYTLVTTDDGGGGLAYTYLDSKSTCSLVSDPTDYEGKHAIALLEKLVGPDLLLRGAALALVNALNYKTASTLPSDASESAFFRRYPPRRGHRVFMVGFFPPVAQGLSNLGVEVSVLDMGRGMGDERSFREKLVRSQGALILSATTIINGTAESFLELVRPQGKVWILGPTTPMVREAFPSPPVKTLGGMVVVDSLGVMKAVRNGRGTPGIKPFCRKVTMHVDTI